MQHPVRVYVQRNACICVGGPCIEHVEHVEVWEDQLASLIFNQRFLEAVILPVGPQKGPERVQRHFSLVNLPLFGGQQPDIPDNMKYGWLTNRGSPSDSNVSAYILQK